MDSRDSNVQQNMPTFCKNGCGFYAASGNEGLCSVCYKEAVKKKQAPPTNMPASFSKFPTLLTPYFLALAFNIIGNRIYGIHCTYAIFFAGSTSSSSLQSLSNKEEAASATPTALETAQPTVVPCVRPQAEAETQESSEVSAGASAASGAAGEEGPSDGKKKKNRCGVCKKKVGLTGFTCRCSGLFCSIHRYSDKHECKFDYKVSLVLLSS